MIRWFAKNHVAANILMVAILFVGSYIAYFQLPVEIEPSVTFPQVQISIPLNGGTPKDVEQKIIIPVENALQDLAGIESVESSAGSDIAYISVSAIESTDLDKLKTDIESQLERISTFPSEAEKPQVFIPNTSFWHEVISVAIYGNLSDEDLNSAAQKVRDDLTSIKGISRVTITGQPQKEITIEVTPEVLNAYNLSIDSLANKIRQTSIDLSAGSIDNNGERILIRSSSQAYKLEQFRNLVISTENGSELKLGDIATLSDSDSGDQQIIRFNNQKAIVLKVLRLDGENSLKIANIVHDYVEKSHQKFPHGVNLSTWNDDSISLKGRLKTLGINLLQGGILVLIFLGLFLRPQIAFWVVAGIPISFAGAIIAMHCMGVTANNMSLFGFIIVLGIVVDDAIVTGENIYTRLKDGEHSPLEAAVIGTQEVSVPVTFGALTTVVAFIPLMFIEGYLGEMARQIPLVVIPVLLFSLIESKLILPAHLKHLRAHRSSSGWIVRTQRYIADSLENFVQKCYKPALQFSLRHRYSTIALFTSIFLLTAGWYVKSNDFDPSPSTDRYFLVASLEMVDGTPQETTDQRVLEAVAALDSIRSKFTDPATGESLIGSVLTYTGGTPWFNSSNPTSGFLLVAITPPDERNEPGPKNTIIANAWEQAVGNMQGVKSFYIRSERNNTRGREASPISIELRSHDDAKRNAIAKQIQQWLAKNDSISTAWTSEQTEQRELEIKLNNQGREAGLTEQDLARQVRSAFYGTQVQKILQSDSEIRVMLKLPKAQRESLHTLDALRISLPNNQLGSITQFATVKENTSPPRISRKDGMRVTSISAATQEGYDVTTFEPALTSYLNKIIQQNPGITWSYQGDIADYKEGNQRLLALAGLLVFALYALIAIPFKSFVQPFLVMLAVPFGIIGAYWGHVLLDIKVSYLSFFGMLALAGVVVNDSLVIVDFINQRRLEGKSIREAIAESGIRRFRPIFLTSITTFAGLMPIIFESSIQAQFLIPMAVSLGFGILFSTVITLFLVPCSYAASNDIAEFFARFHFSRSKK